MIFLKIDTKDLNGRQCSLPSELEREFNLLILGNDESQQQQCETWLSFADRLEEAFPAFRYYGMLIVDLQNPACNSSVDRGTRNGSPNLANSAREPGRKFGRLLSNHQFSLQTEQEIAIFLVRQDGAILWCTKGVWSAAKAESLDEMLLSLTPLADDPDDCLFEDSQVGEVFEHSAAWNALPVFA